MTYITRRLRRSLLGISPAETSFARRGFSIGEKEVQQRLEKVGEVFVQGYQAALDYTDPEKLAPHLESVELEFRGFAYEGAAMALTLLDYLTPWTKSRLKLLLDGPGNHHIYMVYVGAGWALARLRRRADNFLARFDPLLSWLAIDGFGFHEGYFNWRRYYEDQAAPKGISGYACRVFDQGLGRCLWFVRCADVERIAHTISLFPRGRQIDLWSGVGLACAYAGGVERADIEAMKIASDPFSPQLAQGAAFAAKARQRAGNPAPHTELACRVLCGVSGEDAARITDLAREGVGDKGFEPAYEAWRVRIQTRFLEATTV